MKVINLNLNRKCCQFFNLQWFSTIMFLPLCSRYQGLCTREWVTSWPAWYTGHSLMWQVNHYNTDLNIILLKVNSFCINLVNFPAGSTFCQQVSSRTYSDATKETTNQELWALLNSIHGDTKISAKERKRRLGQFYQAHPQIFNQYFGDSAVSVL